MTILTPSDLTKLTLNRKPDLTKINEIEISYIRAKRHNQLYISDDHRQSNLCIFRYTFNDRTKCLISPIREINSYIANRFQVQMQHKNDLTENKYRQIRFRKTHPQFLKTIKELKEYKKTKFQSKLQFLDSIDKISENPQIPYALHHYASMLQMIETSETFEWNNQLQLQFQTLIDEILQDIVNVNQKEIE